MTVPLALAGVVTGLTLYNGAVIAELVRAGVNALPRGQSEAAAALGLRPSQAMRLILLPQAITAMLPALVSQLVVVLKDTAIGYQITFLEMVRQGTQVGAQYGNYLPALMVIAVLMIAVNVTLSWSAVRLELRLRRRSRSAAAPVTRIVEMDMAKRVVFRTRRPGRRRAPTRVCRSCRARSRRSPASRPDSYGPTARAIASGNFHVGARNRGAAASAVCCKPRRAALMTRGPPANHGTGTLVPSVLRAVAAPARMAVTLLPLYPLQRWSPSSPPQSTARPPSRCPAGSPACGAPLCQEISAPAPRNW